MERQKFDDAWQDALKGAEQSPSENVWTAIDNKLTVAEGGTMKRRVIFYQRLAAASILFAVVFGSLTAYYVNESQSGNERLVNDRLADEELNTKQKSNDQLANDQLADGKMNNDRLAKGETKNQLANDRLADEKLNSEQKSNDQLANDQLADDKLGKNKLSIDQLNNAQVANENKRESKNSTKRNEQVDLSKKESTSELTRQKQSVLLADNKEGAGDKSDVVSNELKARNRNFATLSSKDIPSPEANVSAKVKEVTIIRKLPAMPASMMADSRTDKKIEKENFWASIGASTGNYSPQGNFNQSSQALVAPGFSNLLASQSAPNSSSSKGTSYSVGVNVAKKVSERWIVLGGLSYLNQAAGYTTNLASISANNTPSVYSADYASKQGLTSTIALTSPYEINSVNEFVSVPLQAGYLIINRKVGLQINSGVATDIFLQNTLTDKSGQLNKLTESGGSDSPYNSLSWSAIMGSEVSYKIGDQYRVSLVPGLRYSMSPVLKSNSATSNPMVWDLGFRFRYIFK